ncbi:hypothetical protein ACSS6W_004323 [Trichoderma asperelloides]
MAVRWRRDAQKEYEADLPITTLRPLSLSVALKIKYTMQGLFPWIPFKQRHRIYHGDGKSDLGWRSVVNTLKPQGRPDGRVHISERGNLDSSEPLDRPFNTMELVAGEAASQVIEVDNR